MHCCTLVALKSLGQCMNSNSSVTQLRSALPVQHRAWAGLLCLPALFLSLFKWGITPLHSQNLLVLNSHGQGRSSHVEPAKQYLILSTRAACCVGITKSLQLHTFFPALQPHLWVQQCPTIFRLLLDLTVLGVGARVLCQLSTLSRRENPT